MATTLDRCIESIVQQSFTDYEIILVNDGSTDESGEICEKWKQQDARVLVVHQENRGLSAARNIGVSIAQGEYISFVDSDDMIAEGTLISLVEATERLKDYNIIEFPIFEHYKSPYQHLLTLSEQRYDDVADYWINHQGYLHAYSCNKLFKKHLFQEIEFPNGKIFEDVITTARLLKLSGNIATINSGLYYYINNPQGITHTAQLKGLQQLLLWHRHIITSIFPIVPHLFCSHSLYYMHLVNIQLDIYNKNNYNIVLPCNRVSYSFFRNQNISFLLKLKALILNLLGIRNLCLIHNFLMK